MKRSTKKGFTIVELVIVIAIIAILAAVLIPTFASLIQKANESNDIQAAKNMNTFLAMANVTDGVDSILDVYDLFEDSGYSVESYKPLYKDRYYFYDKEYNQILYVDDNDTVLYPTEHKGETYSTLNHNWMSLSMTAKMTKPAGYDGIDNNTITITVKNGAEYAFVINEYNKAATGTKLVLTVDGTIDMMGAACFIEESKGEISITGTNNAVIKNITANTAVSASKSNAQEIDKKYNAAAVVAKLNNNHELNIKDVTFENLNVKEINAGSVSLLVGFANANITLDGVTIKDSTVIGHRDVGAVVGQVNGGKTITLKGNMNLDNVNVMTVGGRAALFGRFNSKDLKLEADAEFKATNSKVSIYESKANEQKFADGTPDSMPDGWDSTAWSKRAKFDKQERYICSSCKTTDGTNKYSVYGYNPDAVIICGKLANGSEVWNVFTSLEDFK